MQALGHFYRTKAQAGIDYVFTYGPLGYFATDVYDAQLVLAALRLGVGHQVGFGHSNHGSAGRSAVARTNAARGWAGLGVRPLPLRHDLPGHAAGARGAADRGHLAAGRRLAAAVGAIVDDEVHLFRHGGGGGGSGGVVGSAARLSRLAVAVFALLGRCLGCVALVRPGSAAPVAPIAAIRGKSRRATAKRWLPPEDKTTSPLPRSR